MSLEEERRGTLTGRHAYRRAVGAGHGTALHVRWTVPCTCSRCTMRRIRYCLPRSSPTQLVGGQTSSVHFLYEKQIVLRATGRLISAQPCCCWGWCFSLPRPSSGTWHCLKHSISGGLGTTFWLGTGYSFPWWPGKLKSLTPDAHVCAAASRGGDASISRVGFEPGKGVH